MSRQAIEEVIGRVLLDPEFRSALFADPDAALAGCELTEAELAALRSMDAESLVGCANMLGGRILRNLE